MAGNLQPISHPRMVGFSQLLSEGCDGAVYAGGYKRVGLVAWCITFPYSRGSAHKRKDAYTRVSRRMPRRSRVASNLLARRLANNLLPTRLANESLPTRLNIVLPSRLVDNCLPTRLTSNLLPARLTRKLILALERLELKATC